MRRILQHLRGIVGDQNTVLRYLFEKVCHVTFIAWCLMLVLHFLPIVAATWSLIIYMIISKTVVRFTNKDWGTFWKTEAFWSRLVYLIHVCSLPLAVANFSAHPIALPIWFVIYLLVEYFNLGCYAE